MKRPKINKRDERGWRVPRAGTRSLLVYEMLLVGKNPEEIGAALGCSRNNASVLAWKIKNPDYYLSPRSELRISKPELATDP